MENLVASYDILLTTHHGIDACSLIACVFGCLGEARSSFGQRVGPYLGRQIIEAFGELVSDVVARKQLIDLQVAKGRFLFTVFCPTPVLDVVIFFGGDILDVTTHAVVVGDDEAFIGDERCGGKG